MGIEKENTNMKNVTKRIGLNLVIVAICILQLSGCASTHLGGEQDGPPGYDVDVSKIPDAVPKCEPHSKYGNPSSYVVFGKRYYVMKNSSGYHERGIASWYGTKFHAKSTSSGEKYSMVCMTAAHKTLPLPTYVQVTNLKSGKHVIVKVNDRGPFHENRIIDLSYAAAKKLGVTANGTALVDVRAIDPKHPNVSTDTPPAKDPDAKLYLQIGAFSQYANAEQLVPRIQPLTSASIRIKEGTKDGQAIYRVQIGPLANVDVTDELHHKLREEGLGEPVTVIE